MVTTARSKDILQISKMTCLHDEMNDLIEIINYCYSVPVSVEAYIHMPYSPNSPN